MTLLDEKSKILLLGYTADSLDILSQSIALYAAGHRGFYRVMTVQLRLLLCDTAFRHNQHEDTALVPILFPSLTLFPLDPEGQPQSNLPQLNLSNWLESPVGSLAGLTIRTLIRRVCDLNGGAHVNKKPLAGLPESGKVRQWMINLARYILPVLTQALHEESGEPFSH